MLAHASCGAAFCSVNSEWAADTGSAQTGSVFDLRYEFIHQDQPRTDTRNVGVGQLSRDHDEVSTANRNLLATYSHAFGNGWGLSVVAPVVDRDHFHLHNGPDGQEPERWKFTALGDVRVLGRFQRPVGSDFSRPSSMGAIFGIKLPTGQTGLANAAGEVAERTLQPGTGTTDAILGLTFQQSLPKSDLSWFGQTQVQFPLNSHEGYRPGAQWGIDLGVRYALLPRMALLVQANALAKQRDSGPAAEPEDSGGRFLSISPGLAWNVTDRIQVYTFLQKPVYQRVNGVQLVASKAIVVGMSTRF